MTDKQDTRRVSKARSTGLLGLGAGFNTLTISIALAFGALPLQAVAQESAAQVSIPAQSLSDALIRLGEQASLQIFYLPETVQGLNAPALEGRLTPDQALQRLLAGTGVEFRRNGANVSLSRPSSGETTQLAPVVVTGSFDPTTEGTGSYTSTGPSTTAAGLGLTLRETPQSVSVMTRQRLDDQGLQQLTDVLAQTPGLYVSQTNNIAADASTSMYSRGFQIDNLMVDGVKLTNSAYQGVFNSHDMVLYDRVEVVRGATGLMNGMGSPGAAVNMIRKRPTRDFQAVLTADAGSWSSFSNMLDVSSPLNEEGSVRGRFVASWSNAHSYIEHLKERRRVVYGVLETDIAPQTQLRGGAVLQWHNSTGNGGALPAYYSDGGRIDWSRSATGAPRWAYTDRRNTTVFAELEHVFSNDWQIKASVSRSYVDSDEVVGWAGGGYPDRMGKGVEMWATHWEYKPRQDVLDISAQGEFSLFGRKHDLVFGGAMSRTSYSSPAYTNWTHAGWNGSVPDIFNWDGQTPSSPYNPAIGSHGSDERLNSVFASLRFRANDDLSFIVGSRITDWRQDSSSHRFNTGITTHTLRKENGVVIPYAAILYDLNDYWTAYTSYTSIFQPQNYKTVSGDYVDPSMGDSYEAGIKGAFFDDRLNVSAALYQIQEDNKAVAIPDMFAPDGSQAYEGKSGTRTRGFEVDVTGQLRPGWEVSASFARNVTQDRDRNPLNTQIPKNIAKLYTSYSMERVVSGLVVGGGVRWQSKVYSDNIGPAKIRSEQPAYAVVDLMARYAINRQIDVTLNVNNVFDKKYRTGTGNSYYGAPSNAHLGLVIRY